jgi:hypothetical protein
MKTVCAWCMSVIKEDPVWGDFVSHGICGRCEPELLPPSIVGQSEIAAETVFRPCGCPGGRQRFVYTSGAALPWHLECSCGNLRGASGKTAPDAVRWWNCYERRRVAVFPAALTLTVIRD